MGDAYGSVAGRRVRTIATGIAVVVGGSMMLVALTVGRCDAFGGRCPAERPSIFADDTFGIAATGAAIAFGIPVLIYGDRDRPQWKKAVIVALSMGVLVGFVARAGASG